MIATVGVVAVPFAALGRSLHTNRDTAVGTSSPPTAASTPKALVAAADAIKAFSTERTVPDLPDRTVSDPPSARRPLPAIAPRTAIGTAGQAASALKPLYRALPHGLHGMSHDDVARHQRTRLYGGMVECVSQRGYRGTTVANVIALAGVSRRAFYEQFSNKEDCFLATYDIVVARSRKRMLEAWLNERGWTNRMHAACKALLDDIAESPKGPRLVLVDALGIGPRGRQRMQMTSVSFERLLSTAVAVSPDSIGFPYPTAGAIVGGVRHILFTRMLEHRERELLGLTDEVLDWIVSYRTPRAAMPRSPLRVSDTPHQSSCSTALPARKSDRARSLASVARLTLDEGYAQLTDPQIAKFAGISTEAFHRQFANKEECLLAALDELALAWASPNIADAESWPEAVHATATAYVRYLFERQDLLQLAFVHLFEVGPPIAERITRPIESLIELLTESGPNPRRGPAVAREAIAGATWELIARNVAHQRQPLPQLIDRIVFIVLAPYIGPKHALDAIQACHKPQRSR